MDRGLLNISAIGLALPERAFMSDTTRHSKGWKMAFQLLEEVGIFWGNVSFACSAIMPHARYFYELLLPEQHSGLDGYLVYLIHHSWFLRSSGAGWTAIWETRSCFHMDYSPPQETFPWLSPRHAQFSVLHCESATEGETWPLLPPCG